MYINKNNEIGFKFRMVLGFGEYTTGYRTYLCCCEEGKLIKSVIDTTTFRYLGSTFYKDKKHIYHYYDMAGGGRFYIYKGVDHAFFRAIGDSYAKNKIGYFFWDELVYTRKGLKDSIRLSKTSYAKDFYAKSPLIEEGKEIKLLEKV